MSNGIRFFFNALYSLSLIAIKFEFTHKNTARSNNSCKSCVFDENNLQNKETMVSIEINNRNKMAVKPMQLL